MAKVKGLMCFCAEFDDEKTDMQHICDAVLNSTVPEAMSEVLSNIPAVMHFNRMDYVKETVDDEMYGVLFFPPIKYISMDIKLPQPLEGGESEST